MSERGLPTLDYMVQVQGHSTTFLGRHARPLIIDRYTLRALGPGALDDALTTYRLWVCLGYAQRIIFPNNWVRVSEPTCLQHYAASNL